MEDHFGFTSTPFTRELAIANRLKLEVHGALACSIEEVVKRRLSALLIAPAGSGKTVVLRSITASLPDARYCVTYFKVSRLSGRDLCREIAQAIGARSAGTFPALVRSVQERFHQCVSTDGVRPVLIFDDAHSLRPEGFELLKILTNYDMDSRLVVSFILAGHPILKDRLYRPELDDVRQRIAHCGELRLLSRDESITYIKHRLAIAGVTIAPFDTETMEGICEMSRGNMRAIDNLAFAALRVAADAKDKVVGIHHLHQARAQLWV